MIEATKQVYKVILRDNVLKKVIHAEFYKSLRQKAKSIYDELEKKYFSAPVIKFSRGSITVLYYTQKQFGIIIAKKSLQDSYLDIKCAVLNEKRIVDIFGKNCPAEILNEIKKGKSFNNGHWVGFDKGSYCVETGQFSNWNDDDSIQVAVLPIPMQDFKNAILSQNYTILTNSTLQKAVDLLKQRSITETANKSEYITEAEVDKLIPILDIDRNAIQKQVSERVMGNYTMPKNIIDMYTDELLACDKIRADLECYDKKCLEDVNSGHWELWSEKEPKPEKNQVLVTLEKPLIARNPVKDIHWDGLIGIDFGTKSTIVSKQDGREKTTLIRIGIGQLAKAVQKFHYENPTIMEFRNLKKFLADYITSEGRPQTSIDDLRVSHTANNDLKSCTRSDEFYSYFYDIKQWCGDTEKNVKIIDQQGTEYILPSFVKLSDNQFNPLELYAYYLGLYINNMRNGIYLDYILSFPVTYEKAVKEKILDSFTKGLKKSLPEVIINDKEVMKKFRVRQGVNEPAAYAITALQGYGFEPDEDENILYSIFDFGGGTTDFDFGLWRISDDSKREEERYDYVIEHFGSEGDKYLGGENLLELLAFEVFKANAPYLGRTPKRNSTENQTPNAGFSFTKPRECDEFPGSETFISDSQEAKRNTKQLMETLRPFWEGIIGISDTKLTDKSADKKTSENTDTIEYEGYIFRNDQEYSFPIKDGCIEVDLFDKDGIRKQKQKLYIKSKENNIDLKLTEILEKRIEKGVLNFFTSIPLAFRNQSAVNSGADSIQIFLAGNSSKSPILRKLFERYISEANAKSTENKPDGGYYHLFPPLGTDEAVKIQRERGVRTDNDVTAPNGKTGVAYGLIAGRDGGKIKVISEIKADEQTKFRYNLGISKRGKFTIKLDRNKVDYGEWVRFIDAGVEDFEIYYTSLPNAARMDIGEQGIYKKRCRLPEVDANKDVYIRTIEDAPEDIEFCVSDSDTPSESAEIVRVHLSE